MTGAAAVREASRELRTPRLLLRRWRSADAAPFAEINGDPRVAEHLPGTMTRTERDALIARIEAGFESRGFDVWAVEAPGVCDLAGFVGLTVPRRTLPFSPCVEIGWRLAPAVQGRGYASEAARAALDFGFGALGLAEIVSFTVPANVRSIAVMERIGMTRDPAGDFDHPALPVGHRLRRHVLYRARRVLSEIRSDA